MQKNSEGCLAGAAVTKSVSQLRRPIILTRKLSHAFKCYIAQPRRSSLDQNIHSMRLIGTYACT